ncbi:MAG TPA: hypothetical protein VFK02_22230 [Kofleriaceae bacterium]|nr:hypothetical protein [Kofleriaceae bacterium]
MGGIRGSTAKACFDQFSHHLNALLRATISKTAQLRIDQLGDKGVLGWADDHPLQIFTKFGKLYFWLAQSLECDKESKKPANERYRLSTREYWYRLQRDGNPGSDALTRWEYMSPRHEKYADKRWCWRHVQLEASTDLPGGRMHFTRLHTPSGYVVIEDVLRFLIHDLGVRPRSKDWHEALIESEKQFKETFNLW